MKTKGALVWGFNQPWSIEEIDIGDPRRGEVKVQMETAGLCHSDHHLMTGDIPMAAFPILGGHEGAGVITEVGPDVRDLAVCPRVDDLLGTFAPYAVVHQSSVVRIDKDIPFAVACLVGCGVTTGYGSAIRSAAVKAGEDVAIIGIGGVGTAALQGAAIAGARRVFAIDPVEWKRQKALEFGATHVFADIESAMAPIAEATRGAMCRKVIVTVGRAEGSAVESWLGLTAKGGTCVLTAMGNVLDTDTTLNLAGLTLLQKSLQGSLFGGGNPQFDIPELLSLYRLGRLNLDDMVTREYTLEQINDGYRDMLEGRNIRGVIRFTEADRS
jgi:S-(hydroxymethyl)glutathione dehydrogenase / alcohol dehydrogenase